MKPTKQDSGGDGFSPLTSKINWKPFLIIIAAFVAVIVLKSAFMEIRTHFHQTKLTEAFEVTARVDKWSEPVVIPPGYSISFEPEDITVRWLVRVNEDRIFHRPAIGSTQYGPVDYGTAVHEVEFALEPGQNAKRVQIKCTRRLR